MFSMIIIMNKDVNKRGSPGIDLVEENLAEETVGRARVSKRVFWRVVAGHRLGRISINEENGIAQNNILDSLVSGLIAGSNEVKRSGVILLGSTGEKFSFKEQSKRRDNMQREH